MSQPYNHQQGALPRPLSLTRNTTFARKGRMKCPPRAYEQQCGACISFENSSVPHGVAGTP